MLPATRGRRRLRLGRRRRLAPAPISTEEATAAYPRSPGASRIVSSSGAGYGLASSSPIDTIGFCQTVFLTSRGTKRGIVAQTGSAGCTLGGAGGAAPADTFGSESFSESFLESSTATEAPDVRSEASASAARSRSSGGRVERTGGVAGEAILACEV